MRTSERAFWSRLGLGLVAMLLVWAAAAGCAAYTQFTNLTATGTMKVDTIAEYTSASGVTIDGLTLKDGGIAEDFALTGDLATTGKASITGGADENQLTVTGYTTQTSDILIIQQQDGTDLVTLDNDGLMTLAAGGGITMPATADLTVLGYVAIGDGTPDGSVAAGTNEELYVEGDFECDGEAEFDGAIDADSTSNFAGTATFAKGSGTAISVSAGGSLDLAATSDINAAGFVSIGDGTPDGTVTDGNDEELYVEGEFEVDGSAGFDGAVYANATLDMNGTELILDADGNTSLTADTDDQIDVRIDGANDFQFTANQLQANAGSKIFLVGTADLFCEGYMAVGDGTPDGDVAEGTNEEFYCEGDAEFDGVLNADGPINADSTMSVAEAATFASSIEVTSNITGAATITGADVVSTDDMTVGDDLTITGRGAVGEWWTFTEQTPISVTAGAIITPTGTNQPLESAAAVTTSLTTAIADGPENGAILILRNDNAADEIVVDNGANTFLSGNITLGTGDTLVLQWDATGSQWVEITHSDNS